MSVEFRIFLFLSITQLKQTVTVQQQQTVYKSEMCAILLYFCVVVKQYTNILQWYYCFFLFFLFVGVSMLVFIIFFFLFFFFVFWFGFIYSLLNPYHIIIYICMVQYLLFKIECPSGVKYVCAYVWVYVCIGLYV